MNELPRRFTDLEKRRIVRDARALLDRREFDPNEPRDDGGKWTDGGGDGGSSGGDSSSGSVPSDGDLHQYLSMVSAAAGRNNQVSTAGFVLQNGKQYTVGKDSFSGKRDKEKLCYMNAGRIALNNPARTYVEGYISVHGVPIQHAWTVDSKGKVYDTTLKSADLGNGEKISGFFGVPFQTNYVAETAANTKVWGVISHTNPDLFSKSSMVGVVVGAKAPPASKTPAQNLLEKNASAKTTMADVLKKIPEADQKRMDKLNAEMSLLKPTNKEFVGPDGTYTQDRQELHAQILERMFTPEAIAAAKPKAGEAPVLILTGGRPAAGKTSALRNELTSDVKSIYISADTIQENLPGYRADYAGLFNGEGQDIALQAEKIAREAGLNITYDATLKSTQPAVDRVELYKSSGYKVHGYFVHTTPETSALRSVERFKATGRYVPPIVSFSSLTNEKTFDTLIPKLDKWAVYDNNGKKPVKVASGGAG